MTASDLCKSFTENMFEMQSHISLAICEASRFIKKSFRVCVECQESSKRFSTTSKITEHAAKVRKLHAEAPISTMKAQPLVQFHIGKCYLT